MSIYKVFFENNTAVSATELKGETMGMMVDFGDDGNSRLINWYVLEAENETQAMDAANFTVRKIWGKQLDLD